MAICETCDYANRPPYKSPCSECDKTMGSPFCCYEHEEKPTNADRIRAMSDEELATQLVQVFKEGIKVLTDMDMPEELLDKFWKSFLERLKQPADMRGEEDV